MARVTVEDCVIKVPNRFELVLLAAQRAREITSGAPLSLDRDDDKNPVVALREIADATVGLPHLREAVVRGMQKHVELDEPEETHEIEVDPIVFGFAAVGAAAAEDAGIEARNFEDADISDEAELDEDLAIDDELDDDEDALEGELAADVLNVEDDDDADLGDLPESDLPESDLPESELPESELPESELPESELPESELPESELPESDLPTEEEDEV